jgi:purine-binding chemotaxis protein CheW
MNNSDKNTYLSFKMNDEKYAFDVHRVIEILEFQKITAIPDSPAHIRGVINFRGDVVPVVDLAAKLNIGRDVEKKFVIIILEINRANEYIRVGITCDKVKDVVQYDNSDIHEMPELGSRIGSEHVVGMVKDEDSIVTILKLDSIFFGDAINKDLTAIVN